MASSNGALYTQNSGRVWMNYPVVMRAIPSYSFSNLLFSVVGVGEYTAASIGYVEITELGITFDALNLNVTDVIGRPLSYRGIIFLDAEL